MQDTPQERSGGSPGSDACANGSCSGPKASGVSRRSFIKTLGASAAVTSIGAAIEAKAAEVNAATATPVTGPDPAEISLDINGKPTKLTVEPATTLLDALR